MAFSSLLPTYSTPLLSHSNPSLHPFCPRLSTAAAAATVASSCAPSPAGRRRSSAVGTRYAVRPVMGPK